MAVGNGWGRDGVLGADGRLRAARILCVLAVGLSALWWSSSALAAETEQITGTVTDAVTHAPIEGVEVCAALANPEGEELTASEGEGFSACAKTAENGDYILEDLASANYIVTFRPPSEGTPDYAIQFYDAASTSVTATPVRLEPTSKIANINAALVAGGQITGTVTSALTMLPVAGVEVCATPLTPGIESPPCVTTEPAGEYSLSGLSSGEYAVHFSPPASAEPRLAGQYYENALTEPDAKPVSVQAGGLPASGIGAALQPPGEISGKVTDATTGAALQNARVCAIPEGEQSFFPPCANTSSGGEYSIPELGAGSYELTFSDEPGYTSQAGKIETVTAGDTTPGADAALDPVVEGEPPGEVVTPPGELPGEVVTTPGETSHGETPTGKAKETTGEPPVGETSTGGFNPFAPGVKLSFGGGSGSPGGSSSPGPSGAVAAASVALAGTTVMVGHHGQALVKLSCRGNTACEGELVLAAKMTVEVKGRKASRTVPIGQASFLVPAGQTAAVQIKLGALGRRLLGTGHGSLSARLAIVKSAPAPRQSLREDVQLVLQSAHSSTR
jgi:hypothetical protein